MIENTHYAPKRGKANIIACHAVGGMNLKQTNLRAKTTCGNCRRTRLFRGV